MTQKFNIGIYVQQRAEPLDFAGPFEVFHNAISMVKDKIELDTFVISKTLEPIDAQGLSINPQYSIADHPPLDILLIPGGGTLKLMEDPEVINWINKVAPETKFLLSVCTGSLVYGKAGLLDGLIITSHFASIDRLKELVPTAQVDPTKRYIDNGKVVTAAGISAGIDMALYMVERLWGYEIAHNISKYMEY